MTTFGALVDSSAVEMTPETPMKALEEATYISEEERLEALRPSTEDADLMAKRKLKAEALITKKMAPTLNPRKRLEQRREERMLERQKAAAAMATAKEEAREKEETGRMFVEERRSWDAYELNKRNYTRMVEMERISRLEAAGKVREEEQQRLAREEEGLTFDDGIVVSYRRWRASPALAAVLHAHEHPAHGMRVSADERWILTGGDDRSVRLWDTHAFRNRLADPDKRKAACAVDCAGAIAADPALGWECVRELVGHTAAVRDVDINPLFTGLPREHLGGLEASNLGTEEEDDRDGEKAPIRTVAIGRRANDGSRARYQERATVRLEHMLASASADLSVRVWDLSFNPRIARFTLRGHKGVVYASRFTPSGDRLASASADRTIRLWNVEEGTEVFRYEGHASAVTALCFSPTGRYLVSCSDIGERAIRVWLAWMPLYDRDPAQFGLRLRWARSGLVKRIKLSSEPSSMAFFLGRQEEREFRESSDESDGEKMPAVGITLPPMHIATHQEYKEKLRIPKSVLEQSTQNPCPSQAVSNGFSLTITLATDKGKDVRTDEYYRGCKLVLRARALNRFTGLYVAGVSAEGLWESFNRRGACRYGTFFKDIPDGMALTAGRSIAAGEGFNKAAGGIHKVVLRWKADPQSGVGWLTFRGVFTFPSYVGKKSVLGRETVWVTLRERPPPTPPAALMATTRLKPRKRNFHTVGRTQLFAHALKSGDWAEAVMMLSAEASMTTGKTRIEGAPAVVDEIRKTLGRNIIVASPISVGAAWTSIGISHEPPTHPSDDAVPAPKSPASNDGVARPASADSRISADATTVAAGANAIPRRAVTRQRSASTERDGATRKGSRRYAHGTPESDRGQPRRSRGSGRRRHCVSDGLGRDGSDSDRCRDVARPRISAKRRGRTGPRHRRRPQQGWRRRSAGVFSAPNVTESDMTKRPRRRGRTMTSRSSEDEDALVLRKSLTRQVQVELRRLKRQREAGVEAWREVGEATGVLASKRAKRRAAARARDREKGLLASAGVNVKNPQENLKVLVWDGCFGADVPELRMPLPELYPLSDIPYDVNEDIGSRALNEALAVGEGAAKVMIEETRARQEDRKAKSVDKIVDAMLDKDRRLRKIARRRRDAVVSSVDLAGSFPNAEARLAPLGHGALSRQGLDGQNPAQAEIQLEAEKADHANDVKVCRVLEPNVYHSKLEGRESREKHDRQGKRLSNEPPPMEPPEDFDLRRRRGGLGTLPGGRPLLDVRGTGDWEKAIARENGGLLRQLETQIGGLICHQDTINAVAFSPDGRRLASTSSDGSVKLWDPSSGKQVRVLSGQHEDLPVWDVAWSADSMFLASCGADRSVVVWNTSAASPFVRRFVGHSDHVRRCAFSGERAEVILTCGRDGTVRQWLLTPNVPAPPPKPFATYKTRSWVMLNWKPAAGCNEEITAYIVSWRLGRKGHFDASLSVAGDQLRRDITGLLPGSLYFFRVAAVNRMGQGAWSETSEMIDTEMDLPLPIERPMMEAITPSSITVSFFAPRPTLPKMKIKWFILQAKGGGQDFGEGKVARFTWAEALAGGNSLKASEKTSRRLKPTVHASLSVPIVIGDVASSADANSSSNIITTTTRNSEESGARGVSRKAPKKTRRRLPHHQLMSLTYDGLLPGTDYHVRVAATNTVGQGKFSLPTYSVRTPAVRPGQCPPPTASTLYLKAISISWAEGHDGGSAITGFVVRPHGSEGAAEVVCGRTKRTHVFDNLSKGRPYSFQVRATNNEGTGPWSEPSDVAWTLTERPAPPRPPCLALACPPPGPLSLWLSLFLPEDDGGAFVTAMLLETREHGGARVPEWSRCDRHVVRRQGDRRTSPAASGDETETKEEREFAVLVDGLKPKTYYSFRTSAVNACGAGRPGPSCRRIRTSAARPPSWNDASTGSASGPSDEKETSIIDADGPRPRAACSGLGACTVTWTEPFSNGAPIDSYEIETVTLGRQLSCNEPGTLDADGAKEQIHHEEATSGRGLVVLTLTEAGAGGTILREVVKRFTRVVPAHLRYLVIRGLDTESETVFRVSAINAAGKGKASGWSEVVRVLDLVDSCT